jgi:tRNA threonylcarbamoyladenosine biosynthesis protein TsaE
VEEVPSPTFTLVQTYPGHLPAPKDEAEGGDLPVELWHFDLYRLTRPEEAYDLAIEEAFATGISLIEWPARLDGLLPARRLVIQLTMASSAAPSEGTTVAQGGEPARLARVMGDAAWHQRLAGLQQGNRA